MRLRKENLPWLVVIMAMLALALLPGAAGSLLTAALLAGGALALATSLSLDRLPDPVDWLRARLSARPAAVSAAAREAGERARQHSGSGLRPGLTLLDIGLIGAQLGPDGMTMRVSRSFSGDDDGLRPWVSLLVPGHAAERSARLRFEMRDLRGATRFVHDQEVWLRAGRRDLLSENQLPLAGDPQLPRSSGEWELRVSVDELLVGILTFDLTPSLRQRAAELQQQRHAARPDAPPSLEELMREARRRD